VSPWFGVSIVVSVLASSCGGRVFEDPSNNTSGVDGTEKTEVADASAIDTSPPPSTPTSKPVADAGPAPTPTPTDAGPAPTPVSCEDGPVTGSPGGCGPAKVCNAGDSMSDETARALLSCYVDRCAMATTGKPWCGTIGLKFGVEGCTIDYTESGPGALGCVKYQGYYRAWPCLAGKSITATRPCP